MKDTSEQTRIRWHCRRGMLELDLLLIPFFDEAYASLSESDQLLFEELLLEEDTFLFAWLMGHETPLRPEYVALVKSIRNHASARHKS